MTAGAKGELGVFEEKISNGCKGADEQKDPRDKGPRAGGMTLYFNKAEDKIHFWEDGDERDKEMARFGVRGGGGVMMREQELEATGHPRRRPRGGQGNGAHELPPT